VDSQVFGVKKQNAVEQDAVIFRNCPFWTLCRIDTARLDKLALLICPADKLTDRLILTNRLISP
jgi:hypothetical protein